MRNETTIHMCVKRKEKYIRRYKKAQNVPPIYKKFNLYVFTNLSNSCQFIRIEISPITIIHSYLSGLNYHHLNLISKSFKSHFL